MIFPLAEDAEVRYVARHLRPQSREELGGYDPQDVARLPGFRWVAYAADAPAAIIGAYPEKAGVWAAYGFGTVAYGAIIRPVTKAIRRVMLPAVWMAGARRIVCRSHPEHEKTHAWLKMMGARQIGAAVFVWEAPDGD